VDSRRDLVGTEPNDVFVDLDGARIEPEPKIDDTEQPLALDVAGLHRQRALELFLGLGDAVVLQKLAASVQMEEEVLAVERAGGRALGVGLLGFVFGALNHCAVQRSPPRTRWYGAKGVS